MVKIKSLRTRKSQQFIFRYLLILFLTMYFVDKSFISENKLKNTILRQAIPGKLYLTYKKNVLF